MENALTLAQWIAEASVPGAAMERRVALRNGWDLALRIADEGLIDPATGAHARVARFLAELAEDGWVRFDYQAWPQDPDRPSVSQFNEQHLQRADNIRLTPEGWRAISAARVQPLVTPAPRQDDEPRHFFISHASEDKEAVARPLAQELVRRGWRVWFDEFELTAGDSLRRSIDRGLKLSRFGVVILSPSFFAKDWPQRELDGLTALETDSGRKVILPIWHAVDSETVTGFSPMLADKLGLPSEMGAEGLADELERVLAAGGEQIGAAPRPPAEPTAQPLPETAPPSEASSRSTSVSPPAPQPRESPGVGEGTVLDALLDQNQVLLREVLRRNRKDFTTPIDRAIRGRNQEQITGEVLAELHDTLAPVVCEYAARLLPLIDHAPGQFAEELDLLGDWAAREPESGFAHWREVPRFACWCLGHLWGTYAVRTRAFEAVGALLAARTTTRYDGDGPLIDGVPGGFGHALAAAAVAPPEGGQKWVSPEWEYVRELWEEREPLKATRDEVLTRDGDPKRAMGEWSFIHCLGLGLAGVRSAGYFMVSPSGARELAARLHRDDRLRARLARDAFATDLDDLDARAPEAFQQVQRLGAFYDDDAVPIFLTGSI